MKVKAEYVEDMKLGGHEPKQTAEFGCLGLEVEHPYNGIGVLVEQGHFGICERDGGIEILKDGKLFWSSIHGYYTDEHPGGTLNAEKQEDASCQYCEEGWVRTGLNYRPCAHCEAGQEVQREHPHLSTR